VKGENRRNSFCPKVRGEGKGKEREKEGGTLAPHRIVHYYYLSTPVTLETVEKKGNVRKKRIYPGAI